MSYCCSNCGYSTPRWLGKCPQCGEWNSFLPVSRKEIKKERSSSYSSPLSLAEIKEKNLQLGNRFSTGLKEVDRVLGGGVVEGSLVLLSGDPGIGKSTLLLKIAEGIAQKDKRVLYVSSEESLYQLYLRVERLGIDYNPPLFLLSTNSFEEAREGISSLQPQVVIIDSIQNLGREDLEFLPGSVATLRDLSSRFMEIAKKENIALFLVGHVTKEGTIAGPKVLEHLVDVVLYLEGNANHPLRLLRSMKNRFGSTQEVGILEMQEKGLVEVMDPSHYFMGESRFTGVGTACTVWTEGKRAMVVEIQSLVHPSYFDFPRRVSLGMDLNRLHLLLAVIEKNTRLRFSRQDVYLSMVGGIKTSETALDLPVCFSLVSSRLNREIDKGTVYLGEVGLSGEIRPAPLLEQRIRESARMGIKRVVASSYHPKDFSPDRFGEVTLVGYSNIKEALEKEGLLG
ncbi:MAG TPA: DNA repair protein RadA [Candidatus Atribacteria bacterium]|nr:DNA repair protein RadA [Candidatus Atribacteria bacterium]